MKYTVLMIIALLQCGVIYSQDSLKCYISTSDFVQKTEYKEFVKPDCICLDTTRNSIQVQFGTTGLKKLIMQLKLHKNMVLTKMIGKKSQTPWKIANTIG